MQEKNKIKKIATQKKHVYIRRRLAGMRVGDIVEFPIEKLRTVKVRVCNYNKDTGKKLITRTDKEEDKLNVIRLI